MAKDAPVQVSRKPLRLPTYLPDAPDLNPMFLEKRVYQGSSGRVYPLPLVNRISSEKVEIEWDAIHLENAYLRIVILPDFGGRIHVMQDKTNGVDLIYNQPVIKPALVGLAGPWLSGGIEFNWPQHHRPSTFMPTDVKIEREDDGSITVWLSEHDPMERMKGMHGVRLRPESADMEVLVRAYNRTPFVQTFLWWANVAVQVHEGYQSFFPPDVAWVADHAKRALSAYPLCEGGYYGVDYRARGEHGVPDQERPAKYQPGQSAVPPSKPNDLSWYANIPVPTSYMCMGTEEDFFGGYDYKNETGLVHVANHHIAPGKKQWTWGNQEFGYAWDRNLTDDQGHDEYPPYIELMAGVYTDNQPDFAFLQPGETKTWSQHWYPIQKIGVAQKANLQATLSLRVRGGKIEFGVSVPKACPKARVVLSVGEKVLFKETVDLAPGKPFVSQIASRQKYPTLRLEDWNGRLLADYTVTPHKEKDSPEMASEPKSPEQISSADELYITGQHLAQYRHATRTPTAYWNEALRRDPGDARCNNALGLWRLRRGEFSAAEGHFRRAIKRLTQLNANPYDGEAFYNLGLCLSYQNRSGEAYDAFYKCVWNQAWQSAGYHALAEIDCLRGEWSAALAHLEQSLRLNSDNLRARNLMVIVNRFLGNITCAEAVLEETLQLDPLDWWARHLNGEPLRCSVQIRLDIALDCARAGLWSEAEELLAGELPSESGTAPLISYYRGWIKDRMGDSRAATDEFKIGSAATPDYCFPARLEEIGILECALRYNPEDDRAAYFLGNLFYDRRRYQEAISLWESAARKRPDYSVTWRNLGIAYFNVLKAPRKARQAYERAIQANPGDARLFFERDQLWKRLGVAPPRRLREFESRHSLVRERDDLCVELCALYNQTGKPERALEVLSSRAFQPWEGGEGAALGQHVRTHLLLGQRALVNGNASEAVGCFRDALATPRNLGEARHILANQSDIHYWLGCAFSKVGEYASAKEHWTIAASFRGDFQEMSVQSFSEMTYFSALAFNELGEKNKGRILFQGLLKYAKTLKLSQAKIDYFATSLPTLLLFEDDLQERQTTKALFLEAQALLGLGRRAAGLPLLLEVLKRDPNHALAHDLKKIA